MVGGRTGVVWRSMFVDHVLERSVGSPLAPASVYANHRTAELVERQLLYVCEVLASGVIWFAVSICIMPSLAPPAQSSAGSRSSASFVASENGYGSSTLAMLVACLTYGLASLDSN